MENKFDFSETIKELEEISLWFQNEEIDLDEGLAKFKKGAALIKKCRQHLKEVENQFFEVKKEVEEEKSNK